MNEILAVARITIINAISAEINHCNFIEYTLVVLLNTDCTTIDRITREHGDLRVESLEGITYPLDELSTDSLFLVHALIKGEEAPCPQALKASRQQWDDIPTAAMPTRF